MSKTIRISAGLFSRLERHAQGFETPASVIERILNAYEGVSSQNEISSEAAVENKRDNTKYLFDGLQYGKGRLVLAVLKKYVIDNPDTNFTDLLSIFPKSLQGPIGVFNQYYSVLESYSGKKHKRHFIKLQEIIQLTDSKIAICTEWGVSNIYKFLFVVRELGYEVTPIMNDIGIDDNGRQRKEDEMNEEILKVRRKVPEWFRKREQINARILIAYLKLQQRKQVITPSLLKAECKDIKTFSSNYNQMRIISDKNHAKVFQEENGQITLWEPVAEFIASEFNNYQMK